MKQLSINSFKNVPWSYSFGTLKTIISVCDLGFKNIAIAFLLSLMSLPGLANEAEKADSIFRKTGFTLGALPAISFDADMGFQYGAVSNLYWYGDGSTYPQYNHSLYLEASHYTAGTTLLRVYFDSPVLFPKIRTTADLTWFRDLAMDFYGFNGYQAVYDLNFEDPSHSDYKSKVFYRHHREMLRFMTNFKGQISGQESPFQWMAGFVFFNFNIGSVDLDRLNKNKSDTDKLPETPGLYDKYVEWHLLKEDELGGGQNFYLKGGLSFDTRNREMNPSDGFWSEIFLSYSPSFLNSQNQPYSRLTLVHRHYLDIYRDQLIFAYRLGWQHRLSGQIPFYILPHIASSSLVSATSQGLGGSKTMRGIRRNRIVGDGAVLGNLEMRYKFLKTILFKQDFYLATNLFSDIGLVTQDYSLDLSQVPEEEYGLYFRDRQDKLHLSYGLGLKTALNENFVLSIDYGIAASSDDGTSGLYINLNYLF
jgi:hypothetical protein